MAGDIVKRNDRGQFMKGTSGNKGGRSSMKSGYIALLKAAVTPAKWKKIINACVQQAIEGDRYARSFLADYVIGRPQQYVELSAVGDSVSKSGFITEYEEAAIRVYGEEVIDE